MKRVLTSIFLLILIAGFLSPADALGAYGGTISIDSVEVSAGGNFALGVWLTGSDMPFSAMTIPLQLNPALLDVDSVSFVASLKPGSFQASADFNAKLGKISIYYLATGSLGNPIPTIPAASGLLATIYGHVRPEATEGLKSSVDSLNVITGVGSSTVKWTRVEVTGDGGVVSEIPAFNPGAVVVGKSTDVSEDRERPLPNRFNLAQNYPNPFNPTTIIGFTIPQAGAVKLQVFNILGQTVRTLIDGPLSAGEHVIEFDGSGMPSGIYFYRLSHLAGKSTRKMVLIK